MVYIRSGKTLYEMSPLPSKEEEESERKDDALRINKAFKKSSLSTANDCTVKLKCISSMKELGTSVIHNPLNGGENKQCDAFLFQVRP